MFRRFLDRAPRWEACGLVPLVVRVVGNNNTIETGAEEN